jgi:hypothetical protein
MRSKQRNHRLCFRIAVALIGLALPAVCPADQVMLLLRNGDRITGTITSQDTNRVVLSTPWVKELIVPVSQISKREPVPPAQKPPSPAIGAGATAGTASPPLPSKAAAKLIAGEVNLGTDLGFSQKNRQLYTGRAKIILAYERLKNTFDYDFSYGRDAGVLSANRMDGSSKTDIDLHHRFYIYSIAGAGYDQIRKIDLRYNVGPGVGYHLVQVTNFLLNTELGLDYQAQRLSDGTDTDFIFMRLAESFNWQLNAKLSWDEKFEFFPEIEDFDVFRFRFETNFRYQLFSNLSLNLTVIDQYDTRPANAVTRNDLQVRSSVGVKF